MTWPRFFKPFTRCEAVSTQLDLIDSLWVYILCRSPISVGSHLQYCTVGGETHSEYIDSISRNVKEEHISRQSNYHGQ